MKKLLLLLALLSTQAFAWDQRAPLPVQACAVHSPYGWATTARTAAPNVNDGRTGVFVYRTFGTATTDVYCEVN